MAATMMPKAHQRSAPLTPIKQANLICAGEVRLSKGTPSQITLAGSPIANKENSASSFSPSESVSLARQDAQTHRASAEGYADRGHVTGRSSLADALATPSKQGSTKRDALTPPRQCRPVPVPRARAARQQATPQSTPHVLTPPSPSCPFQTKRAPAVPMRQTLGASLADPPKRTTSDTGEEDAKASSPKTEAEPAAYDAWDSPVASTQESAAGPPQFKDWETPKKKNATPTTSATGRRTNKWSHVTPEQHRDIVRALQAVQSSPQTAYRATTAVRKMALGEEALLPHTPFPAVSPKSAHRLKKVTLTPGGWMRRDMALSQLETTPRTAKGQVACSSQKGPLARKTTFKKPKKPFQYDRFMPDRETLDFDSASHHVRQQAKSGEPPDGDLTTSSVHNNTDTLDLTTASQRSTTTTSTTMDATTLSYHYQMAHACGVALDKRIIHFADREVEERQVQQQQHATQAALLRQRYNRPIRPQHKVGARRRIPTGPEKILDAPNVLDDFYLNVLDWSVSNIVAIGLNDTVYLWHAHTGAVEELCQFQVDGQDSDGTHWQKLDTIAGLSWASDGNSLAISGQSGVTQIWDVEKKQSIRSLRSHDRRVATLAWNNCILNTGDACGRIGSSDVRMEKALVGMVRNHSTEITSLKWSVDRQSLASAGNDGKLCIWDINGLRGGSADEYIKGKPRAVRRQHQAAVKVFLLFGILTDKGREMIDMSRQAMAWCPWQPNLLATGGGRLDRQICFWNSTNGQLVSSHQTSSQITGLLWSPHYREIMSSHGYASTVETHGEANDPQDPSMGHHLALWNYPTMTRVSSMPHAHSSRILHMATAPDGETVATLAADENLKFWRTWGREGGKFKKGKSDVPALPYDGADGSSETRDAKSPEFLGRFGKMHIR